VDNSVIRTATVTRLVSGTLLNNKHDEAKTFHEDSSAAILAERTGFNIDRRTIAIGGSEEIWLHDLLNQMDPSWFEMIRSTNEPAEMALLMKSPKNLLVFGPGLGSGLYVWLKEKSEPGTKITFVNGPALDAFEQHMLGLNEPHSLEQYDVIDYEDLESGIEDKFDFIHCFAWDIVSDPEVQQWCVDALAPGGVLYVALTNNGTKLYRDAYHSHPYAEFHENLRNSDGNTYHVPALYGHTVFIKN
jgi:SAM-dependent methyltransferase